MIKQVGKSIFIEKDIQINQNWTALKAHLATKGHHIDLSSAPRQFAAGFGNINYYVLFDGAPAVLRRPPMGPVTPGSNDMLREGKILESLAEAFHLAPQCLYIGRDLSILGAPFLIMEYRPGLIIHSKMPDDLRDKAEAAKKLSEELVNILAELHAIKPDSIGLEGLGRPSEYLARTARGWLKRADFAWQDSRPVAVSKIQAWLENNLVEEQPAVLLHNDFKLDNIILDPTDLKPRALIDWDLGTRGDALWDLAVLLSYWAQPGDPEPMMNLKQMPTLEVGFPDRQSVIEQYAQRTARDLSNIRFCRVLAQFRLAVVFQQIFLRYKDTEEVNKRAAAFDKLSIGLLDFAVEISEGTFR
ncbi:MAG: phosphotransferase family protein [Rhodospirillaceae bacterium]|nr:phosphotransferase family protein [Rhodospirillaceae bacterium]